MGETLITLKDAEKYNLNYIEKLEILFNYFKYIEDFFYKNFKDN